MVVLTINHCVAHYYCSHLRVIYDRLYIQFCLWELTDVTDWGTDLCINAAYLLSVQGTGRSLSLCFILIAGFQFNSELAKGLLLLVLQALNGLEGLDLLGQPI